jgi:hypothetical protein
MPVDSLDVEPQASEFTPAAKSMNDVSRSALLLRAFA